MAKILVVGGSLGGLMAANLLLREGHTVTVLEKAQRPHDGRGAGIVTHAELLTALTRAGVTVDDTLGVQVQTRVQLDASGAVVARLALPQLLSSWGRLHALLGAAFAPEQCVLGRAVTQIEQGPDGVHIVCESGDTYDADLLIASDGLRSAVRGQFAPAVQPAYAGYIAWRGVCDEASLSRFTLDSVFEHFGFALLPAEQLIGYPVAGRGNTTARGQRRYNFVWYRPADALALQALLTDADGQQHPQGIAPNKVSWRQIAAMREAARCLLAPQFAEIIEKTAQPFVQPIQDVMSTQLAFGRVALMGDAAFVARPHVGMGVTKAAQDAVALTEAIRVHGATPAALQAYQALRLPAGQAVVQRARELGAYLQGRSHRDAAAVLRQTAVAPIH